MAFVVDTSVAACWFLPDEYDHVAEQARALLRTEDAVIPWLFWFEIRNVLLMNERRGRLKIVQTNEALSVLAGLPIRRDLEPDEAVILTLVRDHKLTVYDAAYLELALRLQLPLATLDRQLIVAARAENINLVGVK